MKILITGCNGQLGSELRLLQTSYPQHEWINTDIQELDITNEKEVEAFVSDNHIDGIVNCAAYTAVDKAETNEEICYKLNAEAPSFLASAIERRKGWMIHISTDYVFDGTSCKPYVETDKTCPNSVYGKTKYKGELCVLDKCSKSLIIRTSWLYSPFGNNFVKTMLRLGNERNELGVIFDQIGTPTYAYDLATAIMTIIGNGIVRGIYHFSNEGAISWYDFTKAIHRISGITHCDVRPLRTSEYPTAATRPPYSVFDKTKIKRTYNLTIPYWEDSLSACINRINLDNK